MDPHDTTTILAPVPQDTEYFSILDNSLMRARAIIQLVSGAVSLLGLGANIVNVVVFTRQGFSESINVSLLGLAVSDMLTLVNMFPFTLISWFEWTDSWAWYAFAFNSSWIAVFISVERCLCVKVPMKVKDIITPKVAAVVIILMFLLTLTSIVPSFIAFEAKRSWDPSRNKTVFKLVPKENKVLLEFITYCMLAFMQNGSFICLLFSTAILIFTLKQKSDWRLQATVTKSVASVAALRRDNQVVKMVILVSTIIVLSYLPGQCLSLAAMIVPDSFYAKLPRHMFKFLWAVAFSQYAVNASINIFIYYNMSSKYKATLLAIVKEWGVSG
ncbi:adenosine receptor A1 [Aplysia californica]|uniref:Adenosine receptor A1 n=1 Tax=Aplysia californica TaxID=6500 RepID=A0ABM0JRI0_APLCA|nr:adenosine receptor A1 [Aplysia californica]